MGKIIEKITINGVDIYIKTKNGIRYRKYGTKFRRLCSRENCMDIRRKTPLCNKHFILNQ